MTIHFSQFSYNFMKEHIGNIMALGPGKCLKSHHKSLEDPSESLDISRYVWNSLKFLMRCTLMPVSEKICRLCNIGSPN